MLYYGTGGGHGHFPWTVMMPTATEIEALLTFTLRRLSSLGVTEAVLFTGHFADEQLAMIAHIAADWNAAGHAPQVRALSVHQACISGFPPDHAGLFDRSLEVRRVHRGTPAGRSGTAVSIESESLSRSTASPRSARACRCQR